MASQDWFDQNSPAHPPGSSQWLGQQQARLSLANKQMASMPAEQKSALSDLWRSLPHPVDALMDAVNSLKSASSADADPKDVVATIARDHADKMRRHANAISPVETPFDQAVNHGSPQVPEGTEHIMPTADMTTGAMPHAEAAKEALETPFSASEQPGMGGATEAGELPHSKGELAMDAAAAILPGAAGKAAKLAKAALPEGELTAEAILQKAGMAKKDFPTFSDFVKQNPESGADMFDYANAHPAMTNRDMLPRYNPAKGASARVADALKNPSVQRGIEKGYQQGVDMMPESWYRTGPLYQDFEHELGPDQAPGMYQRFMQMISATSPRSRVPDNIRTGSYYNYLANSGGEIPEKPATGYGSVAQKLHRQNVVNVLDNGSVDPMQNPKPASFTENLLGNEKPVTIDTHNFRLLGMLAEDPRFLAKSVQKEVQLPNGKTGFESFNPAQEFKNGKITMEQALKNPSWWDSAPAKNEYAAYEHFQQQLADKLGATPANLQEKLWVGMGHMTGLGSPPEPFLRTLAKRIEYTAHVMGVSPDIVKQKLVRGEIPLLGAGGAAVLAGAGSQADQGSKDEE